MAHYIVREGDTLKSISSDLGMPVEILCEINKISDVLGIEPGQELEVSVPLSFSDILINYTIMPGDTLSGIGAKFHCNYELIQIINGIDDPNKIQAGKTLQILTYENFCRPLDDFVDQKSKTLLEKIESNSVDVIDDFSLRGLLQYLFETAIDEIDLITLYKIFQKFERGEFQEGFESLFEYGLGLGIKSQMKPIYVLLY